MSLQVDQVSILIIKKYCEKYDDPGNSKNFSGG